ncbi:MAG: ribosome small subunit-dependent GTPase A [Chitinophagaceae bacterium]|nr:ribosome small subunit-dependent GTPase A [Chitinophagaceae bacterium]MCW5926144.1 ribosome small subunit-dependent GTPase A [Chitinophagaceae bacterium]
MKALVYKSTGSWYTIKTQTGELYNARIRGKLKIDTDISSTNPVTVGDEVEIDFEEGAEHSVIITGILPRKNYINRQSPSNRHHHHIIAANIDQAVLVCTLREPRTSRGFIDRFLVTTEAYHVPAVLVFNKCDLHREKEEMIFEEWREVYESIGYTVVLTSAEKNENTVAVRDLLKDKTSLISGHSGVGKSSLINIILPGFDLKTQKVSGWSGKGMHTTTFAEMFDLPFGGRIIDTPGIREFGLVDITRQELSHYFPEMRGLINECQFNNCLHTNEPGCAVKEAVAQGTIYEERYISYFNILESIEEKKF